MRSGCRDFACAAPEDVDEDEGVEDAGTGRGGWKDCGGYKTSASQFLYHNHKGRNEKSPSSLP